MPSNREKAVAFLNQNFEPWTFDGSEPVADVLTALLDEVSAKSMALTRYPGFKGQSVGTFHRTALASTWPDGTQSETKD